MISGDSILSGIAPACEGSADKIASDAQAMAAFGTARVDHLAATLGSHPNEKTVRALAANNGRLVRAFHDRSLKLFDKRRTRDYIFYLAVCQEESIKWYFRTCG